MVRDAAPPEGPEGSGWPLAAGLALEAAFLLAGVAVGEGYELDGFVGAAVLADGRGVPTLEKYETERSVRRVSSFFENTYAVTQSWSVKACNKCLLTTGETFAILFIESRWEANLWALPHGNASPFFVHCRSGDIPLDKPSHR